MGEQIKENMYQKMRGLVPDEDPLFTAMSHLTDPEEMKQFIVDCAEYYKKTYSKKELKGMNPEDIVKTNIGYLCGSFDKEIAMRWIGLEGITHPLFEDSVFI